MALADLRWLPWCVSRWRRVLVLLWPTRWRYPMLAFAVWFVVLDGLSRLSLGVHYPSDVLAGWTASLGWVIGIAALMRDQLQASRASAGTGRAIAAWRCGAQ